MCVSLMFLQFLQLFYMMMTRARVGKCCKRIKLQVVCDSLVIVYFLMLNVSAV